MATAPAVDQVIKGRLMTLFSSKHHSTNGSAALRSLNLSGDLFFDSNERWESNVSGKTRLAAPQSETASAL
jgi:hypothetical protein